MNEKQRHQVVMWLLAGVAAALFIWVMLGDAGAHSAPPTMKMPYGWKFDIWCCNGDGHSGDCQQIPTTSVKPVSGGYQVTLVPGEHRLVTKPHIWVIPQSSARNSPDGLYYACLYPTEDTLRCFYAPPMGY